MAYLISNREFPNHKDRFGEFYIGWNSEETQILNTGNELLVVEGIVYDLEKKRKPELTEILELVLQIRNTDKVLPDFVTGQFNITLIKDGQIDLMNDFVGIFPVFYSFENGRKMISNNLYSCLLFDIPYDDIGILEGFMSPPFTPFNSRTYFKGVSQLRSGEYLSFDSQGSLIGSKIDSVPESNKQIQKGDYAEIVSMLFENAKIYQQNFNEILLAISGGVDSRITLSSFVSKDKIKTVSYGEKDYIDNRIASEVADYLDLPHTSVSFFNHLFPTVAEHRDQIAYGGEYFVDSWFSILEFIQNTNYISPGPSVILLGDAVDIMRAHSILSLRDRKKRLKLHFNKIFGLKMEVPPYDRELFLEHILKENLDSLEILLKEYPELKKEFNYSKTELENTLKEDLNHFFDFLEKKTNPQNQLNLEEMYYIFTLKRQATTRQVKIFKGRFNSFVTTGSRHLMKKLFGYHPVCRYEEALTSKLFKVDGFKDLARFPTSQIPFIPFKSNLYLKYLLWAYRSLSDQYRIKRGKGRLVKHIEWKKYYENPKNRELLVNLLENTNPELKKLPLDIFDKRASGEAWPYIESDITQYVFLLKLKQLNKDYLIGF